MYVHTNIWSGSCAEEGVVKGSAPPHFLFTHPYRHLARHSACGPPPAAGRRPYTIGRSIAPPFFAKAGNNHGPFAPCRSPPIGARNWLEGGPAQRGLSRRGFRLPRKCSLQRLLHHGHGWNLHAPSSAGEDATFPQERELVAVVRYLRNSSHPHGLWVSSTARWPRCLSKQAS